MPPIAADPSTAPGVSTRHDLTGLALSGGGIRSASFGLGLLQAMSAAGYIFHTSDLAAQANGAAIAWKTLGENVGVGPTTDAVSRSLPTTRLPTNTG